MIERNQITKLSPYLFEIPKSYRYDMRVPARIYASQELLDQILTDQSLEQLVNTATLPGIVKYALAMPDIHQGYGFSIGGVVATDPKHDGVISPGGIGFDINCGVRLLASEIEEGQLHAHLGRLATALYQHVPSGVGEAGMLRLKEDDLDDVLRTGTRWALKKGMARAEDLVHTEESGSMPGADPAKVSKRAKERGRRRSARSAQATTSPRSTSLTSCSTRTRPMRWGSSRARSSCRSIAAAAGWATRSAPTTSRHSSAYRRNTASSCPIANWPVRRFSRQRDQDISRR